ncbi:MAG: serine hydrolase [Desulfamplus sp.]|nr:serine hydrolase [Desulfamplus sp.]
MTSKNIDAVARFMQNGVNSGVFPGAVLLVSYKDEIVFHDAFGLADIYSGQLMQKGSIFDLASLTKPLSTALCMMKLVKKKSILVHNTLGDVLNREEISKKCDKKKLNISIDQLLCHTSGLPAHKPFYKEVMAIPKTDRRNMIRQLILNEPLVATPNQEQIYSDLGYILLAWIIEKLSSSRIDIFAHNELYQLLGVNDLFFIPLIETKEDTKNIDGHNKIDLRMLKFIVPTEMCPWRRKILRAEVHDDNAWAVGGVEGHAGLFGTALAVWRILIEIMRLIHQKDSPLFDGDTLRSFLAKRGDFEMVAGFDTPSMVGSSSGRYFSPSSIGHLGFTGTSFWLDPVKSLIVILLSNRVHPNRENQKIKAFRPKIHDIVVNSICG